MDSTTLLSTHQTTVWHSLPQSKNSANFAVGWEEGQGTEDDADRALEALEQAWSALIEEQQWRQPKSSETHLIWVIFNRNLGGTGLTTSYTDSNFPDGYPVIYLNPDYSDLEDFWASLSAHEFAHAIQYAYRDYRIDGEEPGTGRPPLNGNPNSPSQKTTPTATNPSTTQSRPS